MAPAKRRARLLGAVGGLVSEAASAVGNGILELLAKWMIGAATAITTFVAREMQHTTTPQLQSAWFQAQFAPMADLGAALGLLVALIGLASAAIRRSPEALAATLAGIARAGIGTGLIVALTVIGLGIADQVSGAVVSSSPHTFWATVGARLGHQRLRWLWFLGAGDADRPDRGVRRDLRVA